MRPCVFTARFLLFLSAAHAFGPSSPPRSIARTTAHAQRSAMPQLLLQMASASASASSSSSMPPEDFMQRSKKVKSVLEDDEKPPKLFDDDLLDDMQQSLLKLETRVKEGPGALTMEQVDEFEAATQRILREMKEFNSAAGGNGGVASSASVPSPLAASSSKSSVPAASAPAAATQSSAVTSRKAEQPGVTDTSMDEGPAYDGTGGMGLAKGTANTYIIPGMDEMTPEEYRRALQKSVSDRQTRRHTNRGGVVGNRAALQYLDTLGWGGASSNWKSNPDDDDDEKNDGKKQEEDSK